MKEQLQLASHACLPSWNNHLGSIEAVSHANLPCPSSHPGSNRRPCLLTLGFPFGICKAVFHHKAQLSCGTPSRSFFLFDKLIDWLVLDPGNPIPLLEFRRSICHDFYFVYIIVQAFVFASVFSSHSVQRIRQANLLHNYDHWDSKAFHHQSCRSAKKIKIVPCLEGINGSISTIANLYLGRISFF